MPTLFCGRESETNQLKSLWEKATNPNNPQPQLVTILGESGLGKTRLVQEFFSTISATDTNGYWPDSLEHKGNSLKINPTANECNNSVTIPFLWWGLKLTNPDIRNAVQAGSALNTYGEILNYHLFPIIEQLEKIEKKFEQKVKAANLASDFGISSLPEFSYELSLIKLGIQAIHNLVLLVKRGTEDTGIPSILELESSEHDKLSYLFLNCLSAMALGIDNCRPPTPVCLFIDDAHFSHSDPYLTSFLNKIIDHAFKNKWPILIIVTYWQQEWKSHWDCDEQTVANSIKHRKNLLGENWTSIDLNVVNDLSPLLHKTLPGLTNNQILKILVRAGGSPQYLNEIIEWCKERPRLFIERDVTKALTDQGQKDCLNESLDLYNLVLTRLNRMPLEVKQAVAIASIQGQRFNAELTEEISKALGFHNSNQGLKTAQDPHCLISCTSEDIKVGVASFSQRIFHEVSYDSLPDIADIGELYEALKKATRFRLKKGRKAQTVEQRVLTLTMAVKIFEDTKDTNDTKCYAKSLFELVCIENKRFNYWRSFAFAVCINSKIRESSLNFSFFKFEELMILFEILCSAKQGPNFPELVKCFIDRTHFEQNSPSLESKDTFLLSRAWSAIANLAIREEDFVTAEEACHFLLSNSIENNEAFSTQMTLSNVSKSWTFIGGLYKKAGRISDALEAFMISKNTLLEISQSNKSTTDISVDLARIYNHFGSCALQNKDYESVILFAQDSLKLTKPEIDNAKCFECTEIFMDSIRLIGETHFQYGNFTKAKQAFQQCLQISVHRDRIRNSPETKYDTLMNYLYLASISIKSREFEEATMIMNKLSVYYESCPPEIHSPQLWEKMMVLWTSFGAFAISQKYVSITDRAWSNALIFSKNLEGQLNDDSRLYLLSDFSEVGKDVIKYCSNLIIPYFEIGLKLVDSPTIQPDAKIEPYRVIFKKMIKRTTKHE